MPNQGGVGIAENAAPPGRRRFDVQGQDDDAFGHRRQGRGRPFQTGRAGQGKHRPGFESEGAQLTAAKRHPPIQLGVRYGRVAAPDRGLLGLAAGVFGNPIWNQANRTVQGFAIEDSGQIPPLPG